MPERIKNTFAVITILSSYEMGYEMKRTSNNQKLFCTPGEKIEVEIF